MSYVIDQKNCSGCHRCRVECPVGAITFRNDKYWIDPGKCIFCGTCADVCHNECISDPDAPVTVAPPHEKVMLSCDLVVIGAGASGLSCAAQAAEAGKSVIVLEKGKEVGGSADYAHQIKVHYSKWHKELGLPDTREKTYEEFIRKTEGKVNPKFVRRVLQANGDFFDWLIEKHDLGKDFKLAKGGLFNQLGLVSSYVEPYNEKRIDTMIGPGGHGWWMCRKLLYIAEENGAKVLYHTPAVKLLTDEVGCVSGVLAKDEGGEVEISCRAVAVTAGAFTRNEAIMEKMQPIFKGGEEDCPVHIFTCSHCTGDGITMCEEIGADIDYKNRRVAMYGPMRHPYPAVTLNAFGRDLMITKDGEKFESKMGFSEISPLAYVPGRYVWSIVDANTLKKNIEGAMHPKNKDVVNIDLDKFLVRWPQVMEEEEIAGSVVSGDSLEAVAHKLGISAEKFTVMIESYNQQAEAPMPPPPAGMAPPSEDFDFASLFGDGDLPPMMMKKNPIRQAPFYAIKLKLFHENSIGGMAIDENTNVLRNGVPIPGLYAAGDNTCSIMLPGDIGAGYIETTVTALTFALTSGYIAGQEAVNYLNS